MTTLCSGVEGRVVGPVGRTSVVLAFTTLNNVGLGRLRRDDRRQRPDDLRYPKLPGIK